jgi:hypothetical protein
MFAALFRRLFLDMLRECERRTHGIRFHLVTVSERQIEARSFVGRTQGGCPGSRRRCHDNFARKSGSG